MKLIYRLTHDDLAKAYSMFFDPINNKSIAMLIAWSSQAVMFIIVFAWSLCMDGDELHPVYWLFRFLFLNFIYFIFVHPVFLRRTPTRIIRKIRVWPEDEKERTVEINEKGLEFEDGAGHVHFPLSYIHDVKKNDAYL